MPETIWRVSVPKFTMSRRSLSVSGTRSALIISPMRISSFLNSSMGIAILYNNARFAERPEVAQIIPPQIFNYLTIDRLHLQPKPCSKSENILRCARYIFLQAYHLFNLANRVAKIYSGDINRKPPITIEYPSRGDGAEGLEA